MTRIYPQIVADRKLKNLSTKRGKGLDVRITLIPVEREKCFLLTSPFIEPRQPTKVNREVEFEIPTLAPLKAHHRFAFRNRGARMGHPGRLGIQLDRIIHQAQINGCQRVRGTQGPSTQNVPISQKRA